MATLTKKIIRGRAYYYARESQRVDGKPKIVWQKYLGRLEDIVAAAEQARGATVGPAARARKPDHGHGRCRGLV